MIVDSHVHLEHELPVDRLLDTMDSAVVRFPGAFIVYVVRGITATRVPDFFGKMPVAVQDLRAVVTMKETNPASVPEPEPEPVVAAPPPEQRAWNGRSPGEAATPRKQPEQAGSDREEPPTVEAPPDRLRPATFSDTEPVTPAGRPAAFATEGSAFSRLEAEQAASAAAAPLEAAPLVAKGSPGAAGREPDAAPSAEGEPATSFRREPQRLVSAERAPDEPEKVTEEPGEVDRVMLAKEFSGLLQLNEDGDEENS